MTAERKRFNAELKKKLSKAQSGRCMYHGARVAIRLMEIDHKVPLSKGGSNKIQNLQVLLLYLQPPERGQNGQAVPANV